MNLRLDGKVAVITGSSRGLGLASAGALVSEGARVCICARGAERLAAAVAELTAAAGSDDAVIGVEADLNTPSGVDSIIDRAVATYGGIDILVNNAGQAESAPFAKTTLDQWQRMLAVNLTGTFLCTQAALADVQASGRGRIVNIASTAGQRGYAYVSGYVAAKHGVIGLTRSLALELAARGVTVNAVCPGYTETDIVRESIDRIVARTGRSAEEARAELVKGNPQGRLITPDEVANAVMWLCSDGASSITGQAISVSGGEVM